jgi:hypothetical protein
MSGHKTLFDYVTTVRSMTPEAFSARFPHPFLFGREVLEEEFRFSTVVTDEKSLSLDALRESLKRGDEQPRASSPAVAALPSEFADDDEVLRIRHWVIPVKKPPEAPAQDRVFLGRSETNDLCVPHKTVSKLHAYMQREAAPSLRWFIVDTGSANGTKHNGLRLPPRAKAPLLDGDTLVFGRCVFQWISARSLYERVAALKS